MNTSFENTIVTELPMCKWKSIPYRETWVWNDSTRSAIQIKIPDGRQFLLTKKNEYTIPLIRSNQYLKSM